MSIWTLTVSGDREGAIMFDHVRGNVFGPVFEDFDECERFQHWYLNVGDVVADRYHKTPLFQLEPETVQSLVQRFREREKAEGLFEIPA